MKQPLPRERPTWFGSAPALPAAAKRATRAALVKSTPSQSEAFDRLWTSFMSARILLAIALFGMLVTLRDTNAQAVPDWLLALAGGFVAITALIRWRAHPPSSGRSFDTQWFYTAGVDLAYFVTLHSQHATGINYTPLLVLPVLMTATLGSRALALGTATLATLLLLGNAAWSASTSQSGGMADLAQAGLTGAGLLLVSLLTNQLAMRLVREETVVRRSRNEAQTQALVNTLVIETLPDGVLVVDPDYTVRAANPAAHLLLGADQEVTPDRFSLLDNPAWVQLVHVTRITLTDGPIDSTEITLHHEDRQSSHLQVRTERTPVLGDGGTSLCVLFLQDLREMEARVRTDKLAAMGRMSAAVAHEIRNPLAAISQANALLAEELELPAQQRLTTMIHQNAQRLGHIVDDVLDIARVQGSADANEHTFSALPLDEEAEAFCNEWAHQQQTGARLHLELKADQLHIQFAREHLRRILVNLLDNAARYASKNAAAIEVATRATRHGPVALMVWSDGAPMEPSVQRHLFEPFFSSESRSSGLGLFICRELCERHGANITYERTARMRGDRMVEGNEFLIQFRRVHSAHSVIGMDERDSA